MLAVSTHKPVTTWTNTWATPRWQLGDSVDDHIWPFCSFVVRGVNIALVMWSKAAVCRGIKKWLSGKIKSVVWDIIRILMLTLELVIFVMARTAWGMRSFFLLGICQHYVAWRLQSSVILWSYPCPLYIMMRAERHSPLLPSPHGSLTLSRSLSLHMTHHWHAAILPSQKYSADLLRSFCRQMTRQIFPPPGLSESQCHL